MIVLRALPGLGDFLCAVPALRALRAASPPTRIALVGLPGNRQLVERFSDYVDELLEFPGYPGLPEQVVDVDAFPAFIAGIQARNADLVLQLHGSGLVTNPLAMLLGGRVTAGVHLPGQWCPDPRTFVEYRDHESEVIRPLRVLAHIGVPLRGTALEFPLRAADEDELRTVLWRSRLEGTQYACIHPGSSNPAKRWPPGEFAAVGRDLVACGLRVAVTGVAAEADLTAEVAHAVGAGAVDLGGACSLGAVAALLSRSRLLLCNDTGVSHLAAALSVPSVVVMPWSDPARWAPLDRVLHHSVPSSGDHSGMSELGAQARAAALQLAGTPKSC